MKEVSIKYNNRLGEVFYNNAKIKMWIIEYINSEDMVVEFEDGGISKHITYHNFKKGKVESPKQITVCGIGYLDTNDFMNKQDMTFYTIWRNMLKRCYVYIQKGYEECYVDSEWHSFNNFKKWCYSNYYEISNEKMQLDKDILIKGNKVYSSKTCVFVPQNINKMFMLKKKSRGSFPIGVTQRKDTKKFMAQCHNIKIGEFNTSYEAFISYKNYKENIINNIAEKYKDYIPNNLYKAMINYEVKITD